VLEAILILVYLVVGVALSVACAVIAARRATAKGRRAPVWGVLGFLFGVLAIVALVVLPRVEGAAEG
jgi:hypothetical protein